MDYMKVSLLLSIVEEEDKKKKKKEERKGRRERWRDGKIGNPSLRDFVY
jgi:hypothetical protein